ncbi:eukaryotic rRNA processing protein EBP2-domain-containing protein [Crucibulum laeve]|uniref:Eukaryotic rRNA processing protein EBP2-domain-containing protein n=1 Tax=Crucibulum laeve TaxID=68775 RepID=A0A5C3MCF1_9AGAR|nr:eukaryotic rRNA processing protein EBP2-domain-containing protein [Crucibulum laeve]
MPSTVKPSKGSSKKTTPSKREKENALVVEAVPGPVELSESEESDSEDEGVDEEGMARLMKALGEDGLDEFEQAQLRSLGGDSDEDEDEDKEVDSEGEEVGSGDEGEEGSLLDEDEEEEAGSQDEEEEDEDDDGVPLDEVESVDEDAVPRQKIEIDNKIALERIRETIQLDPSLPWTETLVLSYPETINVSVDDDLNRELAFYKQALHGANAARTLAAKHKFPFTRPADYFAEMVKSDSHMERIRQRLLDESAGIKRGEEKRREREGKKFGKQVQVEKLKERERSKKEMEERLKGLKRKRGDVLEKAGGDDFDIAVEDAIADRPSKRGKDTRGRGIPRSARDQKYGFGGGGRHSKSNNRESTDDFGPRGGRGGRGGGRGGSRGGGRGGRGVGRGGAGGSRGGAGGSRGGGKRLGKSRRMTARSKS